MDALSGAHQGTVPMDPSPEPSASPAPPPAPRRSPWRRPIVVVLGIAAFLTVPAVAGYEVGHDDGPSSVAADATTAAVPDLAPAAGSGARSAVDVRSITDAVDDVVVNITTSVEGGGQAAGTGIVISASGLVLTNNHVISGATGLTVEFAATGVTRSAKVLGYSIVDDVALIQVQNVANLTAADLGSSASLAVGDPIVALGNAGGRGGSPTVVTGTVTALDEEITASDGDGTNVRTLDGLIEVAAAIQSGDSGGPVVDRSGTVVGMSVAASAGGGRGFGGPATGQGYAIPIEDAVAIARKISSGDGGPDIRVGATRAVLGVQIQANLGTGSRLPGGLGGTAGRGAPVVGVESGSGADRAGLREGDVITAVGGRAIAAFGDLTEALVAYSPGDSVEVTWRDASGSSRQGSVKLGSGPPA
jgi:S1-C subfamily serine protease